MIRTTTESFSILKEHLLYNFVEGFELDTSTSGTVGVHGSATSTSSFLSGGSATGFSLPRPSASSRTASANKSSRLSLSFPRDVPFFFPQPPPPPPSPPPPPNKDYGFSNRGVRIFFFREADQNWTWQTFQKCVQKINPPDFVFHTAPAKIWGFGFLLSLGDKKWNVPNNRLNNPWFINNKN